jgi:hypothetical protein
VRVALKWTDQSIVIAFAYFEHINKKELPANQYGRAVDIFRATRVFFRGTEQPDFVRQDETQLR